MTDIKNEVLLIGAAIADITGISEQQLRKGDSNPGKVFFSAGGVSRNIAENLARLEIKTNLISVIGNDYFGQLLVADANTYNLNLKESYFSETLSTATYLCVNDNSGNIDVAIADVANISNISPSFLKEKNKYISIFDYIVIDTNLPKETINYILETYGSKKIFVDTVSGAKSVKIKDILRNIYTIKSNVSEIEEITDIKINDESDFNKVADYLLIKGVRQGFVTRGKEGCFYFNENIRGSYKSKEIKVINSSGAGDAFMAGIVFGTIAEQMIDTIAKTATACAIIATQHKNAVNPKIDKSLLKETILQYI